MGAADARVSLNAYLNKSKYDDDQKAIFETRLAAQQDFDLAARAVKELQTGMDKLNTEIYSARDKPAIN